MLIYGYGNPGRQDDGLGVLLAEELEKWSAENGLDYIHFDTNYQLNIEDAAAIANYGVVIFADASKEDIAHFSFNRLEPSGESEFTMHAVSQALSCTYAIRSFTVTPKLTLCISGGRNGNSWKT